MAVDTRNSELYQQWSDGFIVRWMRQDEGQQVIKWCSELTSISCDLEVALCAREEDTVGFFVGELNGKMVASMVEIPVGDDVRYIGCVYVEERHRKSGFARRMITTARHISEHHHGANIVALDTHPYLESMYEKFGHKTAYKSADYSGTVLTCDIHNRFGTNVRQVRMLSCAVCGQFAVKETFTIQCNTIKRFTPVRQNIQLNLLFSFILAHGFTMYVGLIICVVLGRQYYV